jgi:CHASE2 domain-containing sensor protein
MSSRKKRKKRRRSSPPSGPTPGGGELLREASTSVDAKRGANPWKTIRAHKIDYWIKVLSVIAFGFYFGTFFNNSDILLPWRYYAYQWIQKRVYGGQHNNFFHTALVVLIDDEDYWRGGFAHRRPLKRDHIAKLIRRLDNLDVWVIALDIDLSASIAEHSDYRQETTELAAAIRDVSSHRPIVLARRLIANQRGEPILAPTVFSNADLGLGVSGGFVDLDQDIRRMPSKAVLNGKSYDSFAVAIARSAGLTSESEAKDNDELSPPLAVFTPETKPVSAGEVLGAKPAVPSQLSALAHKIVVVGGSWHEDMYGYGKVVDEHLSPIGPLVGASVHRNYVETILRDRPVTPFKERTADLVEILSSIVLAIALASSERLWWQILMVSVALILLFFFTMFSLAFLGKFFDAIVPVILVAVHGLSEHLGWKGRGEESTP